MLLLIVILLFSIIVIEFKFTTLQIKASTYAFFGFGRFLCSLFSFIFLSISFFEQFVVVFVCRFFFYFFFSFKLNSLSFVVVVLLLSLWCIFELHCMQHTETSIFFLRFFFSTDKNIFCIQHAYLLYIC